MKGRQRSKIGAKERRKSKIKREENIGRRKARGKSH
jgi:hypothetical protein